MIPAEKNFKLIIEYDGTAYHGWQRQKADVTIQSEIEVAVRKLTGKQISLIGSGRTDAGVHAKGQVANLHCETGLSPDTLQRGLNALLPKDIVILDCRHVSEGFHARFDAKNKTYRYSILNRLTPAAIGRQYVWHIQQPLNCDAMRSGLRHIVGMHDFKAFEGAGSPRAHTVRNIIRADLLDRENGRLDFFFTANGFLKHMVRNIVGTLVEVGRGKTGPEGIGEILKAGDRSLAGATAPGHGLCLMRVSYDDSVTAASPGM
ncbi:MAG: tRNA pseudouridine(38-40) synthase TruA [Pseudomonadota bacterium]